MFEFLRTPEGFIWTATAGSLAAVIGAVVSGLAYRGKKGERYSPLNHFISELGEVGVSRLAWVFNVGLILTGLCLVPASISLGLILNTILSKIAIVAGVISALSLSLVGIFPMNRIKPHGFVAVTYFRAGLLMVFLYSLAIAFKPLGQVVISPWFSLAGLAPIFAFASFLVLIGRAYKKTEEPLATQDVERPKVWHLAVVEWLIFITMILWFIEIALGV